MCRPTDRRKKTIWPLQDEHVVNLLYFQFVDMYQYLPSMIDVSAAFRSVEGNFGTAADFLPWWFLIR